MKTTTYLSREEWLEGRRGKILGSTLKDIVVLRGTGKKKGFYQLIVDRLGIDADGEDAMERGTRLEPEAMAKFSEETGMEVDTSLVIWTRDDNSSIGISPDGFVGDSIAVEVKCLSSASHIEAFLTKKVPSEYEMQVLQYFIVSDSLKEVHIAFYDPRLIAKPFFYLTTKREDVQADVDTYLAYEKQTLEEVKEIVNSLTF